MKNKLLIGLLLISLVSCGDKTSSITSHSENKSSSFTPTSSIKVSSEKESSQTSSKISSNYVSSEKDVKTCNVKFETNGGSVLNSITLDLGEKLLKPTDPTREGYKFIGWMLDKELTQVVEWPLTVDKDITIYAKWNQVVNIKELLSNLMKSTKNDPFSFVPKQMRPTYSANHVESQEVEYDFTINTQVSEIKYGGYGEQWNMVVDNIQESERFYNVILLAESAITASVAVFNNYLDKNPSNTASHKIEDSVYTANLEYSEDVLRYSLELKTNLNVPLFGNVNPVIHMNYDVKNNIKDVKIQLLDNIGLKYSTSENKYKFALEYGTEEVIRKAYFTVDKDEDDNIEGHIYEFIQLKGKDVVASAADFYIDDTYVTVVGNKSSGMLGFKGYINELYSLHSGKMLGYEVKETLTVLGVSGEYHTLWFNLNDISGINSVKAIENENLGQYGDNNHDIYLNGSSELFVPLKNSKLGISTSRKYDVELRKQYFYGYEGEKLVEYETKVPMMFIQDDNSKDTNFTDFPSDILSKNKIAASVKVNNNVLSRIREDHKTKISIFELNKGIITSEAISLYINS